MKTCVAEACSRPHLARGFCSMHWKREYGKRTKYRCTCDFCGAEHESTRPNGRFCSDLCRDLWRIDNAPTGDCMAAVRGAPRKRKALPTTCTVTYGDCARCGGSFVKRWSRTTYCSSLCGRRASNSHPSRVARRKGRRRIRRRDIFERDSYMCWICDEPCDAHLKVPAPFAATVDHLVPRVHGGSDEPDNLACAHFICNSQRGASWDLPIVRHAA